MRLFDIIQAFPTFIFALTVAALVGPGAVNLIDRHRRRQRPGLRPARPRRGAHGARPALHRRGVGVRVARAGGSSWHHVVPNSLTPVRVLAPLNCGWAMLTLAGLSFLGLGIPVLEPEWGAMISIGANDAVAGRWWTSVPPGLALLVCVLGFSLIGEGLQQRADRVDLVSAALLEIQRPVGADPRPPAHRAGAERRRPPRRPRRGRRPRRRERRRQDDDRPDDRRRPAPGRAGDGERCASQDATCSR